MRPKITIAPGKRVLIIEDNQQRENNQGRIGWFTACIPRAQITLAKTAKAAVKAVYDGVPYDIIFLDYDTGLDMWYAGMPDDDTFMEAARLIAEHKYNGIVVIHSMNPAGAQRMGKLLSPVCDTRIMPFSSFDLGEN